MTFNYSRAGNPSMAQGSDGNILTGYQNARVRSPTHYTLSNILYQSPGLMYQAPSDYMNLPPRNTGNVLGIEQQFNPSGVNSYYSYLHQDVPPTFINTSSAGKANYGRETNTPGNSLTNDNKSQQQQQSNFHPLDQSSSYRSPYVKGEQAQDHAHNLNVSLNPMFPPPPYNQNFLLNYSKVHSTDMFAKSPNQALNLSSSQSPSASHQNQFYNVPLTTQNYQQPPRQVCNTPHQVSQPMTSNQQQTPQNPPPPPPVNEKNLMTSLQKEKLTKLLKPLINSKKASSSEGQKTTNDGFQQPHVTPKASSKKAMSAATPKNVDDMTTLLELMKHVEAITGEVVKTEKPEDGTQAVINRKLEDTFYPQQHRDVKVERSDASLFKFSSLQYDCVAKLNQLKSEGKDIANPSKVLSEKKLNSGGTLLTGRMFIQDGPCHELPSNLLRCLECKSSRKSDASCRFLAFRRLTQAKTGVVKDCGFCESSDCSPDDVLLWMPVCNPSSNMTVDIAKYLIEHVGNRFCKLVEQEKLAWSWANLKDKIAWKRPVHRVREICDVCATTLFNIHWVCSKCGYVICIDCYQAGVSKWDKCVASRQTHIHEDLVITQIIPTDTLWELCKRLHVVRKQYNIQVNCICSKEQDGLYNNGNAEDKLSIRTFLGVSPQKQLANKPHDSLVSYNANKEFLLKKFGPPKCPLPSISEGPVVALPTVSEIKKRLSESYDSQVYSGQGSSSLVIPRQLSASKLEHVIVRYNLDVTSKLYPSVPHKWLDGGRLLQLLDPQNPGNISIFHQQWRNSQPVLISSCEKQLDPNLWTPKSFLEEFGNLPNDLVDCGNKVVLEGLSMSKFWEGFEHVQNRMKDSNGREMILKLKDWPPTADFSDMLPSRFCNLLQALPLPEYSHRNGVFNIVSRLPDFFVRPDLGPKMYNAYGSALSPNVGSTNLHLDISDAVNLMVYVGVPYDDDEDHEKAAMEAMRSAGCCPETMKRVELGEHKPGALWHIYDPHDSDKIRHLLTKVAEEIGEPIEPNSDPIHDQNWYLDEVLRERLLKEYSVEGYTIVQCVGDAIFIPAGAPHQVRNLHSCIKAAEDFVSPENIDYCFQLTQEFRHLSSTHSNHEDKLQIKNVIFHAIKDAVAVLQKE